MKEHTKNTILIILYVIGSMCFMFLCTMFLLHI
jgi:hypothetical protein